MSDPVPDAASPETSLDPDDWTAFRALGHRMVDDVADFFAGIRDRPAWRPMPESTQARLREPVPWEPQGMERVYAQFRADVLPYPLGNIHPRFWGWIIGSGTPMGALAEFLGATVNPNMSGLRNAGVYLEEQVLEWMKAIFEFPTSGSGLLVSGGSMANVLGLAVGLDAKAEFDVARDGLAAAPRRPVLYASRETHYSVDRGVRLLGLGIDALRKVPVDDMYRIDVDALRSAIRRDRDAGHHPFAVVANAGTINTGAFDPLETLADVAAAEGLWLHVDGAFGAMLALVPELKATTRGMERADSLAFDFHKWLHVPIEAGCVLVRDGAAHRHTFEAHADYLTPLPRGTGFDGGRFANYGPQLSRSFRALKVWMPLKAYGLTAHARGIAQNVAQAAYVAARIAEMPELELAAPVASNVVCFRFALPDAQAAREDALNRELLMRVQESGVAVPSHTVLKDGRFALRLGITNHRSRREDFDRLVDAVLQIGRTLAAAPTDAMEVAP